jgi:hypothetical protein
MPSIGSDPRPAALVRRCAGPGAFLVRAKFLVQASEIWWAVAFRLICEKGR